MSMTKEQALKKLVKMFPDKYVSVRVEEDLSKHPGMQSASRSETKCGIYVSVIGYLWGTTLEECFKQL